jgi:DNA-3-methyladenine glycosylase
MRRRRALERHAFREKEGMIGEILPRDFYERDAPEVARDLLGKILVCGTSDYDLTAGIIVETEAYPGGDDLASHSVAGITGRTKVIFGPAGHAYVYLSYGIHACMNVVVCPEGTAGCVLVRALEPIRGQSIMRLRREHARKDRDLANGPGKLTQAMGITLAEYGADLTNANPSGKRLTVRNAAHHRPFQVEVTPRIGITKCAASPLRFLIRGNSFVSG